MRRAMFLGVIDRDRRAEEELRAQQHDGDPAARHDEERDHTIRPRLPGPAGFDADVGRAWRVVSQPAGL